MAAEPLPPSSRPDRYFAALAEVDNAARQLLLDFVNWYDDIHYDSKAEREAQVDEFLAEAARSATPKEM